MFCGYVYIVQIIAPVAVERRLGVVTIELDPERGSIEGAAMPEFDQPHLECAVARDRNGPCTILAFGSKHETDIGLVQSAQEWSALFAQMVPVDCNFDRPLPRSVRRS